MIDFISGGLKDIWPAPSPEIQALGYAIQNAFRRIKEKADAAQIYAAVDALPEGILDYLAVELRSMYYDQGLDVDRKRTIIKNTIKWYAHAGTPETVEEMAAIIFGVGEVIEWFDFTEPPYTPGTFDIRTSAVLTESTMQQLNNIFRKAKNTRSHLRRVIIEREIHSGAVAVIYQTAVQETTVLNYIRYDKELHTPLYAAASGSASGCTYVLNDVHQDAQASSRQGIAIYGSVTARHTAATNETNGSSAAGGGVYTGGMAELVSRRSTATNETNGSSEAKARTYGKSAGVTTAAHTSVPAGDN